ncbi:hypothetical protein EYF80_024277 [Liparis tanakae]|uniref:Uncharacterized protein n=1 Tax=Liparis tanakae TaxID=230148 RepID=A0A4Z2HHZ3_9TELE|nr:hypothetical protein EYF80_024277 [Liparis tanakae]
MSHHRISMGLAGQPRTPGFLLVERQLRLRVAAAASASFSLAIYLCAGVKEMSARPEGTLNEYIPGTTRRKARPAAASAPPAAGSGGGLAASRTASLQWRAWKERRGGANAVQPETLSLSPLAVSSPVSEFDGAREARRRAAGLRPGCDCSCVSRKDRCLLPSGVFQDRRSSPASRGTGGRLAGSLTALQRGEPPHQRCGVRLSHRDFLGLYADDLAR